MRHAALPTAVMGSLSVRVAALLAGVIVAACIASPPAPTPSRVLGPGEVWLPLEIWRSNGGAILCAGGGFVDTHLHGSPDDPRLTWMVHRSNGERAEVAWPLGHSARFTPALEVLDGGGRVVAVAGSTLQGGCLTSEPGVWHIELAAPPGPVETRQPFPLSRAPQPSEVGTPRMLNPAST